MSKKIAFTSGQWSTLAPIIENIDGGCEHCISRFLSELNERFELNKEMVLMIRVYDKQFTDLEIDKILEEE